MTANITTAIAPASGSSANSVKVTVTESPGTEYVIFTKNGATDWTKSGVRTARSADAAIRDFLSTANATTAEGTYLAIPERSFKPVTVRTQTVTTLKLEEAK